MSKEFFGKIEKGEKDKYRIVASSVAPDRDNEIVRPDSFKNLQAFLDTNPVILWAHDYSKPPVGKATGGKITDDALLLDIEFAKTDFGKEVKYLYDEGFMSSFSVGFIPKNWDRDKEGRVVFTECELLETSCVPVPANAQANIMRSVKSAGVALPEIEKLFNVDIDQTPEPQGETEEEKEAPKSFEKKIKDTLRG